MTDAQQREAARQFFYKWNKQGREDEDARSYWIDIRRNASDIIEKWGTGIPRIYQEAKEYGLRMPELKDFGTSFRIKIFRKEAETDAYGVVRSDTNEANHDTIDTNETNHETIDTNAKGNGVVQESNIFDELTDTEQLILSILSKNPFATQKELAGETGVSISTIKRSIPALQEKSIIKRIGNNRAGQWKILIRIPD